MQEKTASGVMVYLQEELGDARLRAEQLSTYLKQATELIEKSEHRDHFFEVAGHLIYGLPDVAFKLSKALDAAALAAAKLDYEEIKQGLKPEKVEELEAALETSRLRYLNRRSNKDRMGTQRFGGSLDVQRLLTQTYKDGVEQGDESDAKDVRRVIQDIKKILQKAETHPTTDAAVWVADLAKEVTDLAWCLGCAVKHDKKKESSMSMNAKTAAEMLNQFANEIDATGNVPVAKLARFIGALEHGQKTASDQPKRAAAAFRAAAKHLMETPKPSRTKLAAGMRRILAESEMNPQTAGAGEDFQKANPAITDEQAKKIDEEHEKNKDVVKDKAK
jgi:hypothetical protein